MYPNKRLRQTARTNKEYNAGVGKYEWDWTDVIDRKPYRNWKLYRKTQYKHSDANANKETHDD